MPFDDLRKAEDLMREGRPEEAAALLGMLSSRFPHYATPRLLLARALEQSGDREEAAEAWRMIRALRPSSDVALAGFHHFFGRQMGVPQANAGDLGAVQPSPAAHVEPLPAASPPEADTEQRGTSESFRNEAPAEDPEEETGSYSIDTLDDLIYQLENAPRITPAPAPHSDDEKEDDFTPETEDEEIVSETLARIYVTQKQFAEAARVYDRLARQHPERAEEFTVKAEEYRTRADA